MSNPQAKEESNMRTSITVLMVMALVLSVAGCGSDDEEGGQVGTLVLTANGEDFVREGFVSEDGWTISFDVVYLNMYAPTAYQVVAGTTRSALRHGGHPHEAIPEGAAHVALTGEYFLQLKQDTFEVGRDESAPIGNYNQLNFNVQKTTAESRDVVADYIGHSIVLDGTASKGADTVDFIIKFDEEMAYTGCGPNGDAGVLAEGGEAHAEMTFHFDHVFGDIDEGPADPTDEEAVNFLAVGFGPFAELATGGSLDVDQVAMGQQMTGAVFQKLIDAVRTLGHSGEAHCHL
jgi:hypothetical protein